jgi:hypothetical protein
LSTYGAGNYLPNLREAQVMLRRALPKSTATFGRERFLPFLFRIKVFSFRARGIKTGFSATPRRIRRHRWAPKSDTRLAEAKLGNRLRGFERRIRPGLLPSAFFEAGFP